MRIWSRLAAWLRDRRHDHEFEQELDAHRAMLVDEYRRNGLSETEARRAAHLRLGGAAQLRDAHRDVRSLPLVDTFVKDLRYAVRGYRRQPGFTAIAILTIATGIGASAAVFSVVDAVLLRPLPYQNPDALMSLTRTGTGTALRWISLRRWEAMREARSFDAAVYRPAPEDVILGGQDPEIVRGARISANLLGVLGVKPVVGRGFEANEDIDGAPPVALISERLWTRRFARTASIVGMPTTMNAVGFTIIGVLPAAFRFPLRDVDVWFPRPSAIAALEPQYQACCAPLLGVARLRNGGTRDQAAAELTVLSRRYDETRRADAGPAVLTPLKDDLVGRVHTTLWMLMAAVSFVLLIACANVATLLMARARSRTREFAVRTALGAGRRRVVQQLVTESLMLTAVGGALGLVLAKAAVQAVATMEIFDLPRASEVAINGTALAWTMAVACATAVLFGAVPSFQFLRVDLMDRLRQTGSGALESPRRFGMATHGALASTQVALSLMLLIAAVLMAQTIARLSRVDLGFPLSGLLTMRVPLPVSTYDTADKRAAFFEDLVRRVNAIPGVRGATVTRALPTTGVGLATNFQIDGQRIPDPGHIGQQVHTVEPGYFEALRLPLKRGRTLEPRDNTRGAPPVAVVNERFARRFWPSYPLQNVPLGERLFIPVVSLSLVEIVGVVADVRHNGLTRDPDPQIYLPDRLYPPQVAFLTVRADGDPLGTVNAIRAQVRAIDPNQSVTDVGTLDDLLERSTGQQHVTTRVLGAFAAVALALALIGLYGLLSYSVTQRTQEIGIRRVLGATHREVIWMVLGPSLRVTLVGIVLGLAGAYLWTNLLKSLLFGVTATDRATFVGVATAFVVVALFASLPAAVRALRLDPNVILRAD